ncbi:unnamed protein product [Diabrotica balteata]|uniref:DUF7869 domain-containing protein n=1 Tax=Diabrotica balteata TaxID=107213 RepID=A0A9P0E104_DIABA|nr:unnamed protein product [Diabrotica balteata]
MNRFTVCRDMFVKTLGISTKRVNTTVKKSRVLDLKNNRDRKRILTERELEDILADSDFFLSDDSDNDCSEKENVSENLSDVFHENENNAQNDLENDSDSEWDSDDDTPLLQRWEKLQETEQLDDVKNTWSEKIFETQDFDVADPWIANEDHEFWTPLDYFSEYFPEHFWENLSSANSDVEHEPVLLNQNMENLGEIQEPDETEVRKGRKKMKQEASWGKYVRKRCRASGEKYTSIKGKVMAAKTFFYIECNCRLKCSTGVPENVQREVHDRFYKLQDWNAQTSWLCGTVRTKAPKRPRKKIHPESSHYGERTSKRQYFAPSLNISKMYELFKCKLIIEVKPVLKKSIYEKIFRTEFNIHFYIPKKDTCKFCDAFQISLNAESNKEKSEQVKIERDQHIALAQKASKLLKDYKNECVKPDSTGVLITFDLERTLPLPHINTGEVYYLRQMHMLNLGIHTYESGGENVFMNMWYETKGARGSQKVISCLYHYFKNDILPHATKLVLFSDCCGGQNRNWNLLHFLMYMVNVLPNIQDIYVNYLVTGHTYLPNDGDFSFISRAQNLTPVYTPEAWMELI